METILSERILDDVFQIIELIGRGTYGQVQKAKDLDSGEFKALKEIKVEDEDG
ncbi:MAG: hypothetical protein EZS28_051078, partial [Streblomastix strix]